MDTSYAGAIRLLGQAGVRFTFSDCVAYVDPYLSNSVGREFGSALNRRVPAPFKPTDVTDADWVLVTHAHLDHCDPDTLASIAERSPQSQFIAPNPARQIMVEYGIPASRIHSVPEEWLRLSHDVSVVGVPAAHPELRRAADGGFEAVGFVIRSNLGLLYHAGDTSPHQSIVSAVRNLGQPQLAFLPVNERNYYRERADIIGNMSVREAFAFAEELGAEAVVPIHWDLFAPNSVFPEEIELLYVKLSPPFSLVMDPAGA